MEHKFLNTPRRDSGLRAAFLLMVREARKHGMGTGRTARTASLQGRTEHAGAGLHTAVL